MYNFLVYTSLTDWNEPPRSRHQVTNELKERGTVYFVEKSRPGLPGIQLKQVEENVYIFTPSYPVDFRVRYRTPVLNEIYHRWLLKRLKEFNLNFEIVFTFDHTSYLINKFYKNVVYYCGDDFIGNAKLSFFLVNRYHAYIEKRLAADVRLCIVTSEFLHSKLYEVNVNTHIVPLGAPTISDDNLFFRKSKNEEPVLGLVAFINRRMPLDLIDNLLNKFKIIFIGPADAVIKKRYLLNENAEFIGLKKGKELQVALDEVDVCIAPYDEKIINTRLTPNKLWLYLALGKPCVVTDVPNIKNWHFEEKVVYKSKNKDFIDNCIRGFKEDNEGSYYKRIAASKANSWANRVKQILQLYYNH